jgi:hypothetical protein
LRGLQCIHQPDPCRPIHRSPTHPPGACQPKHCSRYSIHPMNIGPYIVYHFSTTQPRSAAAWVTIYPSPRNCRPILRSPNHPPGACQPKHCSRYSIHPMNIGPYIVYHFSATPPPSAVARLTMYSSPNPYRPIHCSPNHPPGVCQPKHCSRYSIHPMDIGPYIVYHLSAIQLPSAAAQFTMYHSSCVCQLSHTLQCIRRSDAVSRSMVYHV